MKHPILMLVSLGGLLVGAGCSHQTLQSRVNERRDVFAGLTPREQAMIKRGLIAVGFSTDMVYLALDKPDRVTPGPGPMQETWIYTTNYAPDGSSLTPSQRLKTHWWQDTGGLGASSSPSGPVHRMPNSPPLFPTHPERNTFTVDYDSTLFQEKTQTNTRISVIFLRGLVADIRIQTI